MVGTAVRGALAVSGTDDALFSQENRVVTGPLVDGRAIGDAIYDLVVSARREVFIEIFEIDERTWLAGRLRAAISALPPDVSVYILSNVADNRFTRNPTISIFPESPAAFYRRLKTFFDLPNVTIGLWDEHYHPLRIIHSKGIVVDGRRALIMDSNLQAASDPRDTGARAGGWHQRAIVMEGGIGAGMRREFAQAWSNALPAARLPAPPEPFAVADACLPVSILPRDAGQGVTAPANQGYLAFFRAAERNLNITTPNFNDPDAIEAVAQATARARVRIILSKGFNWLREMVPGEGGSNETSVTRLARIAANPCNLEIRWFAKEAGMAVSGNGALASHSKWASADGMGFVLGSQNLDTQSWTQSREVSWFVDDPATTAAFDQVFEDDWQRAATAFRCAGPSP